MIFKHLTRNSEFLVGYVVARRFRSKVADTKTFDSVVTNSRRDAFILFYSPKCPHCIKFAPTWEELGELMKNEEVDIVKIDAVNNTFPEKFVVDYYPSMYMKFASCAKSPVLFSGGRCMENLIKFVAKHATNELKAFDRYGNAKKLDS